MSVTVLKKAELLGFSFSVFGDFENPLFLAKDVAEWIEHSDVSTMMKMVDEDEKLIQTMLVSGQDRDMWFITEDGLYELLMQSRKPIAKEFKKGVKVILKSIRKTGSYNVPKFNIPTTLSGALMLAAKQAEQIEQQEALLIEQTPKVEFYEAVTGSADTIDMRTVATVLNCGVGRNKIFEILRDKKILDGRNKPYQSFVDRGYFRTIESSYCKPDGSECINIKTVVFQKGLEFIRKTLDQFRDDTKKVC